MPENDAAPAGTGASGSETPVLMQAPMPMGVSREMLLGIGVGVLFAAASLAAPLAVDVPKAMQHVLLATGVAIILTAFGGQATIAVKSAIFAGVTATMLGILWFLGQSDIAVRMARGQITNFDWRKYEAKLKFADYSESYFDSVSKQFRFVAFDDNMTTAEAVVIFTPKAGDDQELSQIKVPVECFKGFLGKGNSSIDWGYDEARHVIVDKRRAGLIIGSELSAPEPNPCAKANITAGAGSGISLFGKGGEKQKAPRIPLDADVIARALGELEADDPETRRIARDILASGAVSDIKVFLAHLREDSAYRTRLGIAVALTEMLRQDKTLADLAAAQFSGQDFARIGGFIGEGDRTLRIYATEFLFDLAAPAATLVSLHKAAESNDDEAVFSWLFAGQGGWRKMTSEDKAAAGRDLAAIAVRTQGKPKITALLAGYR